MFGRGVIRLGTSINGMLVPKKAIFERGALTSVWVLDASGIARMRLVKPGKVVGDAVEILSGLSDGERIIVGDVERISEGAKVE
jgi:multidrug efflux pump subunit AcrA (membrane-fusion protein)